MVSHGAIKQDKIGVIGYCDMTSQVRIRYGRVDIKSGRGKNSDFYAAVLAC